jgi:hypothetical protein
MTLPTPDEIAPLFVELAAGTTTRNGEVINFRDWKAGQAQ